MGKKAATHRCTEQHGHEAWALWVVTYLSSSENAQAIDELRQALELAGQEYELPASAVEMYVRLGGDRSSVATPF